MVVDKSTLESLLEVFRNIDWAKPNLISQIPGGIDLNCSLKEGGSFLNVIEDRFVDFEYTGDEFIQRAARILFETPTYFSISSNSPELVRLLSNSLNIGGVDHLFDLDV